MNIDITLVWRDDGSGWFVWVKVKGGAQTGFQESTIERALAKAQKIIKEGM